MKPSKKYFVKVLEQVSLKLFGEKFYSYILFLRYFNKFKRSLNRKKTSLKHSKKLDKINEFEYKFTSQNNEDGIINFIFSKIPNSKLFIEIGFSYFEYNSLNLIKNGWSGFLIDQHHKENLLTDRLLKIFFPKSNIKVLTRSINKENINNIFEQISSNQEIDFFSIDIDGNDYWILKNMNINNIKCICLEYNHWIGNNVKKTIKYDKNFKFNDDGYFGASLLAFHDLLKKKEFDLVAVESSGTNAFFINRKYSHNFEILNPITSFQSNPYLYSDEKKKKIYSEVNNHDFEDV